MSAHDIGNNLAVSVHTFKGLNEAARSALLEEIKPFWDQFEEVCGTVVEACCIDIYKDAMKTAQDVEDDADNADHVVIVSLHDYVLGYLLAKEQTLSLSEDMTQDVKHMKAKYDFHHNKSMRINLMCAREQSGVGQQLIEVCKGLGRTKQCASLHLQAIPSALGFYKSVGFVPYQEKEVACWERSDPISDKFHFAIMKMVKNIGQSFPEADAMNQAEIDLRYDQFKNEIDASNRIMLSGIENSRLVSLSTMKKWVTNANFKRMLQMVAMDVFSLLHPDTIPASLCLIDSYKSGVGGSSGSSGGGSGGGSGDHGDAMNDVDKLNEFGFVVLDNDVFINAQHKEDLMDETSRFREYKPGATVKKFVMGGFAALGNPSSYHNPVVRRMRQWAMGIVIPRLFTPLIEKTGVHYNVEKYMDRMTIRVEGESATTESYHRDESKYASGNDLVFGGWINLDSTSQWFHCVPKTHMKNALSHSGFAIITDKEEKQKLKKFTYKIEIPPGHILVFYENMIHEVVSKEATETMVRLHLGWRLTTSTGMNEEVKKAIDDQGVPPIKSGQMAPMYSPMHIGPVDATNRLLQWSEDSFEPQCLVTRVFQNGKRKGQSYTTVHRHMKSLKDYGFTMYDEYGEDERKIYQPSSSWRLLKPGSTSEYHDIHLR